MDCDNDKKVRQSAILEQYCKNDQCVYYGIINNKSSDNETLIKFGNSNDLCTRVNAHRKVFDGFILINAFRVQNKMQVENAMKNHPVLNKYRRKIDVNGKQYTELLAVDSLTFTQLNKIIRSIIANVKFSNANYGKLLEENEQLKAENELLKAELSSIKSAGKKADNDKTVYYHCEKCEYITSMKNDYNRHLTSNKHNKPENNEKNCSYCNYKTLSSKYYKIHLLSKKHKNNVMMHDNYLTTNQCNNCRKILSSYTSLWRHKKTCIVNQSLSNDITFVDTI
jgi:regulator of replication initiation timing